MFSNEENIALEIALEVNSDYKIISAFEETKELKMK